MHSPPCALNSLAARGLDAACPCPQAPSPVSSDDGYNIFCALLPAEAASGLPRQPAAQHPGGVPGQADGFQMQPTDQRPGVVPDQTNSFHVQSAARHPNQGPGEDSLHMYAGQPDSMDDGSHQGVESTPATPTPATPEPGADTWGSQSNVQQLMQVKDVRRLCAHCVTACNLSSVRVTDLGACLHFCVALLSPPASALAQHFVWPLACPWELQGSAPDSHCHLQGGV